MKKHFIVLLVVVAALSACNNTLHKKTDGTTDAVFLKRDDEQFLALKDTAQHHLKTFIDSLAKHQNDDDYRFMVKSDFVDGQSHEHMWSAIFEYKGGMFQGLFNDSAFVLKNIKRGDRVKISNKDIEDWAIFDNKHNITTGNFSDKYLKGEK